MQGSITDLVEKDIWQRLQSFFNWGLHLGQGENAIHVTIGLLLLLTLAFVATSYVLRLSCNLLTRKMGLEDRLKFVSIFQFVKYVVYLVVILVTMSAAGINVTVLLTASAALFVGLGLALQQLFQDLLGGILIMIDKSLQVGDIVEVEGKVGKVFEIKLRTTRTLTRDDKVVVIPNHKFISKSIYNYTQNHKTTRERVAVRVAHGSNVEKVSQLLIEAALAQPGILKQPTPFVLFEDFAEFALLFSVNFYITDSFSDPKIKSDIRFAIDQKFRANQIQIPLPQQEIRIQRQAASKNVQ